MKRVHMLSLAVIAALALSMSGCADDGKDGVDGAIGATGPAGSDGTNGESPYVNTPAKTVDADTMIVFEELGAPVTDAEKSSLLSSQKVTYTTDGQTDAIGFTKLIATTDVNNNETFGLMKDYQGQPITFADGSPYICNGTNDAVGSGLDHSSLLQVGGRLFMVSQFECEVGGMYGMELEQAADGTLSVKDNSLQYISQTEGYGGWVHCAGMTTPWNSHLGSEEYEPNARDMLMDPSTKLTGDKYFDEVTKFFWKDENNANTANDNNPYFYGWIPEVTVDASAATPAFDYSKHFSMGRAAWEMAYVMPDAKTAYLSDDGTNVGFFMYVADAAQDLSAGTLYAAKWIQTSNVGAGEADIIWIRLGHATDAQVKAIVDQEISFHDIFAAEEPVDGACPTAGFTSVNTTWGNECLKLQDAAASALSSNAEIETAAAFLETRRYAAMQGATTEFRKEEGITFNPDHGILYVAMSEIRKGMEDGASQDTGGSNDIRLQANKCGAVYGLDVYGTAETAYDGEQNVIQSAYVVKNMYAVVTGSPVSYPADSAFESYSCSVNGIANPDNVTYLAGQNVLAIGEDTGAHPNDFVWAFDIGSGALTRILSTPYGSETTSPFWYGDVNGYGYLSIVTQHPFGEVSSDDVEYSLVGSATASEKESFVGVVGPFDFIIGDGKGTH